MDRLNKEQAEELFRFNKEDLQFNMKLSLISMFEKQCSRTPDAVALDFNGVQIRYSELNSFSNRVASLLLKSGTTKGDKVGICIDRSHELIIGILGILKAGAAYVPFDSSYPKDRINYMLEQSAIRTMISDSGNRELFMGDNLNSIILSPGLQEISNFSDQNPQNYTDATSSVYVLFTSGSTGLPKGVEMAQRALVNLVEWQAEKTGLGEPARTLQFAPVSFDVSFQEIFTTLTSGGTLILIDDEMRLNAIKLLEFIEANKIERLFLPFIALQHLTEVAEKSDIQLNSLKDVITAGEQLQITKHVSHFFAKRNKCRLHNHYGPTETHVVTAYTLSEDVNQWDALPPIGIPVSHTHAYILDENLIPVKLGDPGELYIAGASLAKGYLNRKELTEERFLSNPFSDVAGSRMYKTGDLARYRSDGNIEYLGRADNQVKVRGYRIEPGEIELTLVSYPGITKAAVIVREDKPGDKRLVAYLVSDNKSVSKSHELRKFISGKLPEYMMPSAFVFIDQLPLTPSGKVDRNKLPAPDTRRPDIDTLYVEPKTEDEKRISELWSELLQIDKVGLDDNFFYLGGNSLLALQSIARLRQQYGMDIPVVKLYQHPSINGLLDSLKFDNNKKSVIELAKDRVASRNQQGNGSKTVEEGIAIVGIAGRFPGAENINDMWKNLINGQETTAFFTNEELDPFIDANVKSDPLYVKARGVIKDADKFDAAFFAFNPRLAELMDPQHRIFMEVCWEALESAGYTPDGYKGLIGVYAGMGNNTYYHNNVVHHKDVIEKVGSFQVMVANEKDYIATRISHVMNLKGPAVSVHTACSTSLTAVSLACSALWNNQCDMALAGGVSITSPVNSGHLYIEGGMFSADGHTRPFDEKATGTVFSDGSGVVILKRYRDAIKDGDSVYAVIRGTGINNDGSDKASFTAPSVEGQAAAVAMAQASANVNPESISYVETHGTATPLGDPIEIEALSLAFGNESDLKQYCAIGSVKSNFGHLTAAAGVAGLIKTVLALKHKVIPPTINYSNPNPSIKFENTPFYVNSKITNWTGKSGPLRAGVSSFGVGGTNVHVVLEEAPSQNDSGNSRPVQLMFFSAKSKEQTEKEVSNLNNHLTEFQDINLADTAFTLQKGRVRFKNRRFILIDTAQKVSDQLLQPAPGKSASRTLDQAATGVAFMFPGQGSQYLHMGSNLYRDEIVFKDAVDRCAEILQPLLGTDIRQIIYPEKENEDNAAVKLKETIYTQPALFTIGYALSQLWKSWGIIPDALIGHSIGEFCAACVAGVFSLEDALKLVASRGRMMQELPSGSMLSVRLSADDVSSLLTPEIAVAAVNGPDLCVVSGTHKAIEKLQKQLEEKEIVCKKLFTSHAFHSPMMDPIVAPFKQLVASVRLNKPNIKIFSTATSRLLSDEEATDPAYWSGHLRKPVLFADGIKAIWNYDPRLFLLELGPRNTASALARQQVVDLKNQFAVPTLSDTHINNAEWNSIMHAIGQLWLSGIEIDWDAFYALEERKRIALPTYPFVKNKYWVNPMQIPVGMNTFHAYNPFLQNENTIHTNELQNINSENMNSVSRKERIIAELKEVMEEASGIELNNVDPSMTFMEMGMDSLFLTQAALTISKKYSSKVTFRQLNEDFSSLGTLANHLDSVLPADSFSQPVSVSNLKASAPAPQGTNADQVQWLIMQQMQIMQQQLAALNASPSANSNQTNPVNTNSAKPVINTPSKDRVVTESEKAELEKPFGAIARIEKSVSTELNELQKKWLSDFTQKYNDKTRKSKEYTQHHRAHLADPRVVTGFKPNLKELVYQAVVDRSEGCRIFDIDGNEYVDVLNGFGSNFLGYGSPVVIKAVEQQLKSGIEIGPQHPLAGEMAELICEFTGYDRAGLCNTGSEAVLGAMRIARTVTGRGTIVCFNGSYHGINDEVIVRGTKKLKSFPAAAGIMPESVQNMLVLDYGTDEALEIIRDRKDEIAAVLVEPIQSRRADFRPKAFLEEVRKITNECGAVLIFDEVITGFRLLPGGAQEFYGIRADLSTYGKVIGGGMPIGAIAGKKEFMDALDGGFWSFGDASVPEAGVTYFAGTFVRHPLALAAGIAVLKHIKQRGRSIYEKLNGFTDKLVSEINIHCKIKDAPFHMVSFGSLFKVKWDEEQPYGELVFLLLREKGVHIYDGFPCFITDAFTESDVDFVINKFKESLDELQSVGFLTSPVRKNGQQTVSENVKVNSMNDNTPPVPGARLGKDADGRPAWFVNDPDRPGKYIQLEN